jgi:hypothetical protein
VFGLIKIDHKNGGRYYIKEASKQGHEYDPKEGLIVKDVDAALVDI